MSAPISFKNSALLLLDFQNFVLKNFVPAEAAAQAVHGAASLLEAARTAGILVVHVMVSFRPGYPEINPRNTVFSWLKESGLVVPGGDGSRINAALLPTEIEPIVTKHRVGAFSGTDLECLLKAQGIDTLILAGVTTSGVVLSTVRQGFDFDFTMIVGQDACADDDAEVHQLLLEKVIASHARVEPVAEIIRALHSTDQVL